MKRLLFGLAMMSSSLLAATPYCVAHRSLGFGGLENSLEAFELAIQNNADGIEFDLRHTKDQKTLIFHDKKLKRVSKGENCDLKRAIEDQTFFNIRQNCKLQNNEAIPTLEEGLELLATSNTKLLIEFKDKMITESDFETIKKYYQERPELVSIISFNSNILEAVVKKSKTDDYFKKVGIIRLKKFGFFGNLGQITALSTKYIHRARVHKLQSAGVKVGAYTKDSEKRINKYLDKDVDFITTNESILCQEIVSKR